MKKLVITVTFGLVLAAGHVLAAGDVAKGKAKAAQCAACHANDGNSASAEFPKLAGQHASYTLKQLEDFKAGRRQNAVMAGMVAPLSEEDMADLSAYYAAQSPSGGFASEARVALGEKIYRGGNAESGVPACMACHGPAGAGDPLAGFPALAGQHPNYIAAQLNAFRDQERTNDAKSMMRDVARWMTKDEITAVSEYIAGLH